MIKGFLAYELAVELHRKIEKLELGFSLKDQLNRASQSVVLNLAEGSAKPSTKEKKRFYAISFGSIREVQAVFDLIKVEDEKTIDLADHVAACLYKLTYH